MKQVRQAMRSPAVVLVALALGAALVGTAIADPMHQATTSASAPKIAKKAQRNAAAALRKANRALRIAMGTRKERGPQGVPGAPGAPGVPGAPGAEATNLFAVVSSNGTFVRGTSGATSEQLFKPGTDGAYEVDFGRNLTDCALIAVLANIDSADANPPAGEIGTAYRNGNPDAVFVKTLNSSGVAADRSFHLAVFC